MLGIGKVDINAGKTNKIGFFSQSDFLSGSEIEKNELTV